MAGALISLPHAVLQGDVILMYGRFLFCLVKISSIDECRINVIRALLEDI